MHCMKKKEYYIFNSPIFDGFEFSFLLYTEHHKYIVISIYVRSGANLVFLFYNRTKVKVLGCKIEILEEKNFSTKRCIEF